MDRSAAEGSATVIHEIQMPERQSKVEMITVTPEEAVVTLVEKLRKDAKVL